LTPLGPFVPQTPSDLLPRDKFLATPLEAGGGDILFLLAVYKFSYSLDYLLNQNRHYVSNQ